MPAPLAIVGGETVGGAELTSATVLCDGGLIVGVDRVGPEAEVVDAEGLIVAPGFVDLQVNGGVGIDLTTEPDRMWELGEALVVNGVSSFLPTIVSSPSAAVDAALAALADRPAGYRGAEPLGLHLEGPMLNPERVGAHERSCLAAPAADVIADWSAERGVAMVTLAPELDGALPVIETLVKRGVVVAAGHCEATAADAEAAFAAGATAVTHLFNAMAPLGHRQPGLAGFTLAGNGLTPTIIADGIHVDPLVVAATWRALGPGGLALVTDAVAPTGKGPGRYRLGGRAIVACDDAVRTEDGALAGSVLTMDRAVRNLVDFTGCGPVEAIGAATATPASLIGAASRGRIEVGAVADLVLLDANLEVVMTIVGGRVAHRSSARGR